MKESWKQVLHRHANIRLNTPGAGFLRPFNLLLYFCRTTAAV